MSQESREAAEAAIGRTLLEQWDPLQVRNDPARADAYSPFAHELYSLLARGCSNAQLTRHLQRLERDELKVDRGEHDLSVVVASLRAMENSL